MQSKQGLDIGLVICGQSALKHSNNTNYPRLFATNIYFLNPTSNRQRWKNEQKSLPERKGQRIILYIKEIYKDMRMTVNAYKPTGRGNKVIITSISY